MKYVVCIVCSDKGWVKDVLWNSSKPCPVCNQKPKIEPKPQKQSKYDEDLEKLYDEFQYKK